MGISRQAFHRYVKSTRAPGPGGHGVGRRVEYDFSSGKHVIESAQDCRPVLKENAELRQLGRPTGWARRVARIPNVVILQWLNMGVDFFNPDHQEKVANLLDSPEYSDLRTDDGQPLSKQPTRSFFTTFTSHRPGVQRG